jgi:hypothetical protein
MFCQQRRELVSAAQLRCYRKRLGSQCGPQSKPEAILQRLQNAAKFAGAKPSLWMSRPCRASACSLVRSYNASYSQEELRGARRSVRGQFICALRSQFATLKIGHGQHRKYLPRVFTEHGAIMAATILNSPRAIEMGVYVVRALVQLREMLASNKEQARRFAQLENRLDKKLTTHDEAIAAILAAIRQIMHPPVPKRRPIGFTADLRERVERLRRHGGICMTTAAEFLSRPHSDSTRCRPQSCVSDRLPSSRSLLSEADIEIARSGRTPRHAVTVTCALKPIPARVGRPCGRKPQSADRPCSAGGRG